MYSVLLSLARKIVKSRFAPDVIVGVSRGGWVPARVLCDLLSTPVLANVGVEFYAGVGVRKGQPDYHGKKTSCWIVFPWETKETIRSIVAGSKWEKRKELDDLEHARLSARQAQRFLNRILKEKCQNR
jgi:hypoxanthine phosphoribosyltransferase